MEQKEKRIKDIIPKVIIILIWIFVWQLLSSMIHNSILLAGPIETISALSGMFLTGKYWESIGFSAVRIIGGFCIGSVIGICLAWASYQMKFMEEFLSPVISVLKAIPVASFVIIILIWSGNKMLSLYVTSLIVMPVIYLNTLSGLKASDIQLLEMAKVFRMSMWRQLRYIYIPGLRPALYSAFQAAMGMAWKSGVAAEVIGQPIGSIGNGLYQSKIYLETADLFAWTITIIVASYVIEKLLMKLMDKMLCIL